MSNLSMVLMMLGLCLASENSLAQACPSREEVSQTLNTAIDLLDESNATENEIIMKLKAIITGPVAESQLNSAWMSMHKFAGGNWKGVDRRLKQAVDMMGYLNGIECLKAYNSELTSDSEKVDNDQDCPSREEVRQTLNAAIDLLDESNATENEIKARLESIIENEIQTKDLIRTWMLISTDLGGGDLRRVHPKLKSAAYLIGEINQPECLVSYNKGLTSDSENEDDSPIVIPELKDEEYRTSREQLLEMQQVVDAMRSDQKRQSKAFFVIMAVVLFFQCILMFQQIQIKNKI